MPSWMPRPKSAVLGAAYLLAVAGGVHLQGFPAVTQRPEDGVDGVAVPGQIHRDAVVALDIPQGIGQVAQGVELPPADDLQLLLPIGFQQRIDKAPLYF